MCVCVRIGWRNRGIVAILYVRLFLLNEMLMADVLSVRMLHRYGHVVTVQSSGAGGRMRLEPDMELAGLFKNIILRNDLGFTCIQVIRIRTFILFLVSFCEKGAGYASTEDFCRPVCRPS